MNSATAPGWFGKLVLLGDFAHRRLPPSFISTSDAWLSRSISASRAQLGPRWLDTYLTGPVWRFAWAPGVVDSQWWFGVLMPSVDAAGRYFPLLVAGSDQNLPMSADGVTALSNWYAHAGRAALATLQPGATLERFEADLALAPRWQDFSGPQPTVEVAAPQKRLLLPGAPALMQWAGVLASPVVAGAYARHTLWSPAPAADDNQGSFTTVSGLPAPEQFSLLLEGRW